MGIARTWLSLALATLFCTGALAAQDRAERLRQELEVRFAEQVRTQLGLNEEQAGRVREIMGKYARQRRSFEAEERRLRQALNLQLRPGIAAEADSVGKLVDRITEVRVAYVRLMQDEMKELTPVLSPVQRGQLLVMRDRILQRIQELREQRRPAGLGRSPPP